MPLELRGDPALCTSWGCCRCATPGHSHECEHSQCKLGMTHFTWKMLHKQQEKHPTMVQKWGKKSPDWSSACWFISLTGGYHHLAAVGNGSTHGRETLVWISQFILFTGFHCNLSILMWCIPDELSRKVINYCEKGGSGVKSPICQVNENCLYSDRLLLVKHGQFQNPFFKGKKKGSLFQLELFGKH